ncbi:MAG: NUDIX domain-containing protein [Chloroflexota bacterium]
MGKPTYSAGGILLRKVDNDILIAIVEWETNVPPKWAPILRQLPKGGCQAGESFQETAVREVLEETGYRGRIIGEAGEAHWSYERDAIVWDEKVLYYFMLPKSLTPDKHDEEFDRVRWIKLDEAAEVLSYPEERELILKVVNSNSFPELIKNIDER